MKQEAASFASECIWHLRHQGLGVRAQLATEHDDNITLRFTDRLAQKFEFVSLHSHLARGQSVVGCTGQREHGGVFRPRPHVNKLRRLLAQANWHAVNQNQFCTTIAYCLTNLFGSQRLKFFRLAANQKNSLRMTNVVMSCQGPAKILEEGLKTEGIGHRVVFRFNHFVRELSQTIERFVSQPGTTDYG